MKTTRRWMRWILEASVDGEARRKPRRARRAEDI